MLKVIKTFKDEKLERNKLEVTDQNKTLTPVPLTNKYIKSTPFDKNDFSSDLHALENFHAVIKKQHAETIPALMYTKEERNYIGSTFHKTKDKTFSSLLKTCPSQLFGDKHFLYLPEQIPTCIRTIMIECF